MILSKNRIAILGFSVCALLFSGAAVGAWVVVETRPKASAPWQGSTFQSRFDDAMEDIEEWMITGTIRGDVCPDFLPGSKHRWSTRHCLVKDDLVIEITDYGAPRVLYGTPGKLTHACTAAHDGVRRAEDGGYTRSAVPSVCARGARFRVALVSSLEGIRNRLRARAG